MPRPLPIFSQSDYLIWAVDMNSHTECKQCRSRSVGFCFQRQGISGFGWARVKTDRPVHSEDSDQMPQNAVPDQAPDKGSCLSQKYRARLFKASLA